MGGSDPGSGKHECYSVRTLHVPFGYDGIGVKNVDGYGYGGIVLLEKTSFVIRSMFGSCPASVVCLVLTSRAWN